MPAEKPIKIGGSGLPEQFGGSDTIPIANLAVATQAEAEAGTSSTKMMTPQRTAQAISALGGGGGGGAVTAGQAIAYAIVFGG
jgi:hypothetical protein